MSIFLQVWWNAGERARAKEREVTGKWLMIIHCTWGLLEVEETGTVVL